MNNYSSLMGLPDKQVHELSITEMKEVDIAEGRLNDRQWNRFQDLLEAGRTVSDAFENARGLARNWL